MTKGSKVAIVCCSNGQVKTYEPKLYKLIDILKQMGLVPICSDYIFEKDSICSGTGKERATALMKFYKDPEIRAIFDISGGDIANEILPYLDFEMIAKSKKVFWGYSDLTTIMNAIYTKTGMSSVLYQVRNLMYKDSEHQIRNFQSSVFGETEKLYDFKYRFIQGYSVEGIVVGGNIRCLLKLAGTEYWPDMLDNILLLEGYSGTVAQMITYLCQLEQLGVFKKVKGIILGTFTEMEVEMCNPTMIELVQRYVGENLTIVKTEEIGHGSNSKAIAIGKKIRLDIEDYMVMNVNRADNVIKLTI